ncbi:phage integrase family protein [Paramagnetospirillum caucaseum]|uniref:Phage integrase family protein n=1 Tax=Paramagnetospirillum caucaseum TaxID=1244869 RepID=M2Y6D7_9PROT|nr:site-specific integrase [Paramagnetospirillum caucaseum]EME68611.1 phage integrase family protein [Paramagnetospirillum caucaseum]
MKKKLTDRYLQTVKAPEAGRVEIGDTEAPGLFLRITATGVMSWCVRYCPKGGKQARATIGIYRTPGSSDPVVSLSDARTRAKDISAHAARGVDLLAREDAEKASAVAADEITNRTMRVVVAEYIEKHCKPNQRRWKLTERMFEAHVLPKLGDKPVSELRRADVIELLDDMQHKGGLTAQVNRVHAQIKAALNFAAEREYIDANPAAVVKKQYKGEKPRSRVLSDDELKAIWKTADNLNEPSRSLVKMLILTGQRRDEVRCLPWPEIDLEGKLWTLPASRNKGKREHVIPLSPEILALLEEKNEKTGFVFSVTGRKPYAGQKRLKEILDRDSEVTGWTLHDIRRTVASGMAALNIPHDTIGRVLNHAKGDVTAVHYNRHEYLTEKRAALETWARHVAYIVGDGRDAKNIIPLRKAE